jgi:hypothetical protein
LNYDRKPGERSVEVHWHLVDESLLPTVDFSESWARRRIVSLSGAEAFTLSPEDLLLHLCVHIMHDQFQVSLRSLCDIDRVVAAHQTSLDWDYWLDQIRTWRLEKGTYLILHILQELLHTPLPREVVGKFVSCGQTMKWTTYFKESVLQRNAGDHKPPSIKRLERTKGMKDKILLILSSIFLPPVVLRGHYALPSGNLAACLGYAMRTRDLLRRHSTRVLGTAWERRRGKPLTEGDDAHGELLQWALSKDSQTISNTDSPSSRS